MRRPNAPRTLLILGWMAMATIGFACDDDDDTGDATATDSGTTIADC